MNKCCCFCIGLVVYLLACINVTIIIVYWLKPELLSHVWWRDRNKVPEVDVHNITTNKTDICPDWGCNNSSNYKVYWNMPSIACKQFGYTFTYAIDEFGITMNEGDPFRGNKISILYNPGLFPSVVNYKDDTTSLDDIILINGGIPQDGNLLEHLEAFEEQVDKEIPDPNNDGLIIIDMEQWGVTWEQNFGEMLVNHRLSIKRVRDRYPDWTIQEISKMAKEEYDIAAKRFMLKTIRYGKVLRPKGKWGYYQYPQCFNRPKDTPDCLVPCSSNLRKENDRIIWLYHASDILYPSLYLAKEGTVLGRAGVIRGMVQEATRAERCTGRELPNIPYIWFKYFHLEGYIDDEDLENLIVIPREEGSHGVVMWGAYKDFSTSENCLKFSIWLNGTFGPMVKRILNSS